MENMFFLSSPISIWWTFENNFSTERGIFVKIKNSYVSCSLLALRLCWMIVKLHFYLAFLWMSEAVGKFFRVIFGIYWPYSGLVARICWHTAAKLCFCISCNFSEGELWTMMVIKEFVVCGVHNLHGLLVTNWFGKKLQLFCVSLESAAVGQLLKRKYFSISFRSL